MYAFVIIFSLVNLQNKIFYTRLKDKNEIKTRGLGFKDPKY